MLSSARLLKSKGYHIYATAGTSRFLTENGVDNTLVYWPSEQGQPQALDMLHKKEIDMVVNIPLLTNARLASAFISAFCTMTVDDLAIKSWSEYQ